MKLLCWKCKIEKPLEAFKPSSRAKFTGYVECNNCTSLRRRLRYSAGKAENELSYNRNYYKKLRVETLKHYGGSCACCGETTFEFLSFDHLDNSGAAHRKINGTSAREFVFWLRKNNYPSNIQILCHNCNLAKGFYGVCPHIKELQDGDRNDRQNILFELECS